MMLILMLMMMLNLMILMIVVQVQESSQAAWFQIDLGEEHLVSGIQVGGLLLRG